MPWLTLVFFAVLFAGCKQKSKEEAEPVVAPSASAAQAETAPTPPPQEAIPPPMQPPSAAPAAVKAPAAQGESIKSCCAALHKEESAATGAQKSVYQNAATSCDAISKLVAAGTTKKSAAMTQVRASLRGGGKLPAGCD
jgi:hypothetical protein